LKKLRDRQTDRQTRRLTLEVATAHKPIESDPKVYTTKQLQLLVTDEITKALVKVLKSI